MRYRYLPHTADAKIEAFGKDLNEVFSNSALAVYNIVTDTSKIKPAKEINIDINSENKESLLFDWIDELLFYLDAEKFLLNKIKDISIKQHDNNLNLKATLTGDRMSDKYKLKGAVKSMTYNCMKIEKTARHTKAVFVVDR